MSKTMMYLSKKGRKEKIFKKKTLFALVESVSPFFLFVLFFFFMFLSLVNAATPTGPDSISVTANETKGAVSAYELNVSGGYITTINITSTTQNPRWKGMVGQLIGTFTLDDASGSTLYDWSLTTIAGEVYATRNSSTITWTNLTCASVANLEQENSEMSHTNVDDNLTATFNITTGATHNEFFVATRNISENSCPTLNTYVNNATQDTSFEEVALYEAIGDNIIYATIIEEDVFGFDNQTYDFQMIVPENGASGFDGATAYYLYVELS